MEEDQEVLRSKIMGTGNFGMHSNNVTIYVMIIFNEAKYLEPPLPFRSFVRHISKHLPREVQILSLIHIFIVTDLDKQITSLQFVVEALG